MSVPITRLEGNCVLARSFASIVMLALACAGCQQKPAEPTESPPPKPAQVDVTRIINADQDPGNWVSHGRTYSEQRFSPLHKINAENVKQLGLAWSLDLDTH